MGFIASHTRVQDKMFEEINKAFGEREEIGYEDTKHLSYTLSVFKESLRLLPVAPNLSKKAYQETYLGEYFLPEGTNVVIDAANLHKNPKYWRNPEEFRPERFLEDEVAPNSFIPFSLGSRSCIGQKFAEVEVVIALALILRKYKLHHVEGGKEPSIQDAVSFGTTSLKNPLKLLLTKRE